LDKIQPKMLQRDGMVMVEMKVLVMVRGGGIYL
jgi:hypothetical protein